MLHWRGSVATSDHVTERVCELANGKGSSREAVPSQGRLFAFGGSSGRDRGGERASSLIEGVGARWAEVLAAVVLSGSGLTVSSTSDGGAVAISFLHDGKVEKKYAANDVDLEGLLSAVQDYATALCVGT